MLLSKYREVIGNALVRQTGEKGLTGPDPHLAYCLVAGKVHSEKDRGQRCWQRGTSRWGRRGNLKTEIGN